MTFPSFRPLCPWRFRLGLALLVLGLGFRPTAAPAQAPTVEPPRIVGDAQSVELNYTQTFANFTFALEGGAPDSLIWLKNGEPVQSGWWGVLPIGADLHFFEIWEEAEGTYQLVAENAGGRTVGPPLTITVNDGPRLFFSPPPGTYTNQVTVTITVEDTLPEGFNPPLFYRTDGVTPFSVGSHRYTGPFVLTGDTLLAARLFFLLPPVNRAHFAEYRVITPTLPDAGPDAQLLAHYRFDESSGLLGSDDTRWHAARLTAGGAQFTSQAVSGNALELDATQTGYATLTPPGVDWNGDWTISMWFRASPDWREGMGLVTMGGAGTPGGFYLGLNPHPGGITAYLGDGQMLGSSRPVNDGRWHHVALVRTASGDSRLHVDGGPAHARYVNSAIIPNNAPLLLGAYGVGNPYPLMGAIDDVQIYRGALSDGQVTALASSPGNPLPLPVRPPPNFPRLVNESPWVEARAGWKVALSYREEAGPAFEWQWYHNGTPIPGANAASLVLPSLEPDQAGTYYAIASNSAGSTQGKRFTINLGNPLVRAVRPGVPTDLELDEGWPLHLTYSGNASATRIQWFLNDTPIPGATQWFHDFEAVSAQHDGDYYARVESEGALFYSPAGRIQILLHRPPTLTAQPQSATLREGERARFTTSFLGARPMTFQWHLGDVPIPGATADSLTLPAVTASHAGRYTVVASNSYGSVTSETATLEVLPGPILDVSPPGGPLPATVSLSYSPNPPYYFIRYTVDGSEPTSSSTLYRNPIALTKPCRFRCALFSGDVRVGPVVEHQFTLPPGMPVITTEPEDISVSYGDRFTLRFAAEGQAPMSYFWYQDGLSPIQTQSPELLTSTPFPLSHNYYAVAANAVGRATSRVARITVKPKAPEPLRLDPLPAKATAYEGGSFQLFVGYGTSFAARFTWFKDGVAIPDAAQSSLNWEMIRLEDSGSYTVRLSDGRSEVWSGPTQLEVRPIATPRPIITKAPMETLATEGYPQEVFRVEVRGALPIRFAWFHNDVAIPGATNRTLFLPLVREEDAGLYHVVVSNAGGEIASPKAKLSVNVPVTPESPRIQFGAWDNRLPGQIVMQPSRPVPTLEIRYTLNGTPPRRDSPLYTGPIPIDRPTTVQAALYEDGFRKSHVAIAEYTPNPEPPRIVSASGDAFLVHGFSRSAWVKVAGTPPFEFQWYVDGEAMISSGNSFASYDTPDSSTINPTAEANTLKTYHVTIRNRAGSIQSAPMRYVGRWQGEPVVFPPDLLHPPAAVHVAEGGTTLLEIAAEGSNLTFEWHLPRLGMMTTRDPWIPLKQMTLADAGKFWVRIYNQLSSVSSPTADLVVVPITGTAPPVITRPPGPVFTPEGSPTTLVVDALGTPPLTYRWNFSSAPTIVTDKPWVTLPAATPGHGGMYSVTIESPYNSVQSKPALLTLLPPSAQASRPTLPQRFPDVVTSEGRSHTFHFSQNEIAGRTYFWRFGDEPFLSTSRGSLTLPLIRLTQAGPYFVILQSPTGTDISAVSTHTVLPGATQPLPVITRQPVGRQVAFGAAVSFSVEATSTLPLTYAWTRNGTPIASGPAESTLNLARATSSHGGEYQVTVSHRDGKVTSIPVSLVVAPPIAPTLVSQPADQTVLEGALVHFAADLAGDYPFNCAWYHQGELRYTSDAPELTLANASSAIAGEYQLKVSNPSGTVLSRIFRLTVATKPPEILESPLGGQFLLGSGVSLSVVALSSIPMTFQWLRQGLPIPGATGTSIHWAAIRDEDAGDYSVVVANASGSSTSAVAHLEVFPPSGGTIQFVNRVTGLLDAPVYAEDRRTLLEGPEYVAQLYAGTSPDALAPVGLPAPFRTGVGAGYWDPRGTSIRSIPGIPPGTESWVQVRAWALADGATYEEAHAARAAVGDSQVFLITTGGAGTPPSLPALLLGLEPFQLRRMPGPTVRSHPQAQALGIGAPLTLSVSATGDELRYQWYRDGQPLPDATESTFHLDRTSPSDAGRYHALVSNPGGAVLTSDAQVTVSLERVIFLRNVGSVFEGGIPRLPLHVWRAPETADLGRVDATLRFDPQVLEWLDLELPPSPAPQVQLTPVTAGALRVSLTLPSGASTGTNILGFALFRARDITTSTVTPVTLEDVAFTDRQGQPLPWGSSESGTTAEILARPLTGDNNGNGFLDLGDPALIATLVTRPLVTIPKWMIAENDFDLNGRLDRADVQASLEALIARDLEFLSPLTPPTHRTASRNLHGTPPAPLLRLSLTPADPLAAGATLTVRIDVHASAPSLRATAFSLRFPAAALSVKAARLLAPGALWQDEGSSSWKISPPAASTGQGHLRFASTTSRDWRTGGGSLVEWDFEVLPGASAVAQASISLEEVDWTRDGYTVNKARGEVASFALRAITTPRIQEVRLVAGPSPELLLLGAGDPGSRYAIESFNGQGSWTLESTVTAGADGTFRFSHAIPVGPGMKFFRVATGATASAALPP